MLIISPANQKFKNSFPYFSAPDAWAILQRFTQSRCPRWCPWGDLLPCAQTFLEIFAEEKINEDKYFEGIIPEVWNYHIGGYQVLHKYLKDPKGRNMDDPVHYCRIATAISKTIELQKELDELFEGVEVNELLMRRSLENDDEYFFIPSCWTCFSIYPMWIENPLLFSAG